MATLAPKLGISDVGLKKRCKVKGIPTPGRGYWAKLSAGKPVKKEPLPQNWIVQRTLHQLPKSAEAVRKFQAPGDQYPADILSKHPVRALKKLSRMKPDRDGLVTLRDDGLLGITVSPAQIERGVWLWSQLIERFSAAGLSLQLDRRCSITDGIESVTLLLKESRSQFERPFDPKIDHEPYWGDAPKTVKEHVLTGFLVFQAEEIYGANCRRIWRDTPLKPLDERLDQVVDGLVLLVKRKRELAVEAEEKRIRWELERQENQKIEREHRLQKQLRKELIRLANEYSQAEKIRRFVRDLQQTEDGAEIASFKDWAFSVADSIDPRTSVVDELKKGRDPVKPTDWY